MPYLDFLRGLLGLLVFLGIAWAISENRPAIHYRAIIGGLIAQVFIALLLTKVPTVVGALGGIAHGVDNLQRSAESGAMFVFGYLGGGSQPFIKAYVLSADGSVATSRVFFDGTEFSRRTGRHGGFDGLKVDAQGNLWTSGPGGILVINPQGKLLGSIVTARATANCAFGDADHQTLYITANESLLRVRTLAKGAAR